VILTAQHMRNPHARMPPHCKNKKRGRAVRAPPRPKSPMSSLKKLCAPWHEIDEFDALTGSTRKRSVGMSRARGARWRSVTLSFAAGARIARGLPAASWERRETSSSSAEQQARIDDGALLERLKVSGVDGGALGLAIRTRARPRGPGPASQSRPSQCRSAMSPRGVWRLIAALRVRVLDPEQETAAPRDAP